MTGRTVFSFSCKCNCSSQLCHLKEGCYSHFLTAFSGRMHQGKQGVLEPVRDPDSYPWSYRKRILPLTFVLPEQDWGTKDQEPRTQNSTSAALSVHNQRLRNTEHSPNRPLQGKNFMEPCKAGATNRYLECAKPEVKLQPCNQSFLFGLPHKAARKLSN